MSTANTPAKKRVLMIVANPSVSTTLGWPVGFWASELTHAWYELTQTGHEVTVASPEGGKVEMDAMSDPRDASGYSAHDLISMGFLNTPKLAALLENTPSLKSLNPADFDAVVVTGGQSPMFTFPKNARLQQVIRDFYEAGKPTAALCHGTTALLDVTLSNGAPLIEGKTMTGFANSEENYVDQMVGKKVMPFRIEDEAKKRGAKFVAAPAFAAHAVHDGNLITGQQHFSGRKMAELVIEALKH